MGEVSSMKTVPWGFIIIITTDYHHHPPATAWVRRKAVWHHSVPPSLALSSREHATLIALYFGSTTISVRCCGILHHNQECVRSGLRGQRIIIYIHMYYCTPSQLPRFPGNNSYAPTPNHSSHLRFEGGWVYWTQKFYLPKSIICWLFGLSWACWMGSREFLNPLPSPPPASTVATPSEQPANQSSTDVVVFIED